MLDTSTSIWAQYSVFYEEVKELREIVIVNPNILFQSHTTGSAQVRETGEISKEPVERFKGILEDVGQSVLTPYHVICLLRHFKLLQKMEREGEVVFFYALPITGESGNNRQFLPNSQ